MPKILIYTKDDCSFCERAKSLLRNLQLEFEEKRLTTQQEFLELKKLTGWMTFPQVFIGEKLVGGYQELSQLNSSGKLEKLLGP